MRKVERSGCRPTSSSMRNAPNDRTLRPVLATLVHVAAVMAGTISTGSAARVASGNCGAGEETIGCS